MSVPFVPTAKAKRTAQVTEVTSDIEQLGIIGASWQFQQQSKAHLTKVEQGRAWASPRVTAAASLFELVIARQYPEHTRLELLLPPKRHFSAGR
ncbi:MAG TPA: hypothetical protein VM912_12680 [Terriglobales bacterium]|nr:hypothetical protein [Terriglobales bacterium]